MTVFAFLWLALWQAGQQAGFAHAITHAGRAGGAAIAAKAVAAVDAETGTPDGHSCLLFDAATLIVGASCHPPAAAVPLQAETVPSASIRASAPRVARRLAEPRGPPAAV